MKIQDYDFNYKDDDLIFFSLDIKLNDKDRLLLLDDLQIAMIKMLQDKFKNIE